jgi:hypothetical protein
MPLAVFVGLKVPHAPAAVLPQVAVQPTPALFTSLATTAVRLSVPDVLMLKAEGDTETVMGRIVIVALADFVESPTDVAVIVIPPAGDVAGAVYAVDTMLRV